MTSKKIDDFLEPQERRTATDLWLQLQQRQEEPKYKIVGFYRETEFQETPIGNIPKEWKVVKLGEIVEIYDNKRIPLSEQERATRKGPYPYCGANGVIDYIDGYIFDGEFLLLAEDGGFFGRFEQSAYIMNGKFWANNHVHVLKAREGKTLNKFLMYMLNFLDLTPYVVGSTRPKLTQRTMKEIKIPLPPLEEQWGIAEVLSSVDQAIEAVDRLVQKFEYVKRVLMQELLTKGIGHKEFQDTPIGNIPKEWKITKLAKVAQIIMGQSPPSSSYNEEGIGLPFLQGKAEFGRIFPKPRLYTSKPTKIAEKDDLLISVRAPVGDVNIAPYRLCIGRGLAAIRFNSTSANVLFYFYYFQHIKPILEALGKGTTFKAITRRELEDLQVPLPPVEEQRSIAEILYSIDQAIEANNMLIQKLEHVKKTLMNLLLTGIVRVIVEKEHESAS